MNVFEFLGLPADHRPEDKVVHRVKNLHEVPESKLKWPAWAQEKLDGVSSIVLYNGKHWGIFSRTGKQFTNCDEALSTLSLNGSFSNRNVVYLCELICPSISLEELSGAVNPNRTEPLSDELQANLQSARLICFDAVTVKDFVDGCNNESGPFDYRFFNMIFNVAKALTVPVSDLSGFTDFANSITTMGGEGAVLKQVDAPWVAGKKDYNYTKLVCGCDFDLEVLGVEEGKGKRKGMAANLLLRWRMYGKPEGEVVTIPVDGRFDDSTRIHWFNNPSEIVGKVVHVHALQLGSKGLLRLAKVHEVRIDKTVADL
jgi:ATP-dependent DNA ligase